MGRGAEEGKNLAWAHCIVIPWVIFVGVELKFILVTVFSSQSPFADNQLHLRRWVGGGRNLNTKWQ